MNKIKKWLFSWQAILALQFVASVVLTVVVFQLGIFPPSYMAVFFLVLFLLLDGMFFFMRPSRKHRRRKDGKRKVAIRPIVGRVLSVLLSVVMLIGASYISIGNSAINKITDKNIQTTMYSLVVMEDSKYNEVGDIDGQLIGIHPIADEAKDDKAIAALKKEVSITTQEINSTEDLTQALYNGDVEGLLVNGSELSIMETADPQFEEKTRIIWTYNITEIVEDTASDKDVASAPFTMLISGVDSRGDVSVKSRSDVNMLVTVNPETHQILMTSIPRDYYVTLANVGQKDKLTHSGLFGTENVAATVSDLLDVDVDFYTRVNFAALEQVVDALGGIDVYSDQNLFPISSGGYSIPKGMNHMDGATALTFSRERHSYASGDVHRTQNQQDVLQAIINKMTSTAVLTHYTDVLDAVEGSFQTNMSSGSIKDLVTMQLKDGGSWDFQKSTLVGTGTTQTGGYMMPSYKLYYMIPDEESVQSNSDYIKAMLQGEKILVK